MAGTNESRPVPAHFEEELFNKYLGYTHNNGWKYEFWVPNHDRIVYTIHGGPMSGRSKYQTAYYQRIRPNLWQISWLEETGTVVSMALDLTEQRVTTFMSFSWGHWNRAEEAHGYKRDKLEKWRELANETPKPRERHQLPEQATIDKIYQGKGSLQDIEMDWPTL